MSQPDAGASGGLSLLQSVGETPCRDRCDMGVVAINSRDTGNAPAKEEPSIGNHDTPSHLPRRDRAGRAGWCGGTHTTRTQAGTGISSLAAPHVWTRTGRTRADSDALTWWADEMTTAHAITALPPCWPAHERLVLELDAIRSAWIEAQAARNQGPSSLLASWYHYTRWPFWDRIDHKPCRGHH